MRWSMAIIFTPAASAFSSHACVASRWWSQTPTAGNGAQLMTSRSQMDRAELDRELDELAGWVPTMLADTDEASQMDAFACHAEAIEDRVAEEDHDHLWSRLQCILRGNGLIPGDDEPCAD